MKLVLLPGMDGTGHLFRRLVEVLPAEIEPVVVQYPRDRPLPYPALVHQVLDELPAAPHLIFAESFSGPIGVRIAAGQPDGLAGLILCATFVHSPVFTSISLLGAALLRIGPSAPPALAIRSVLAGMDAAPELVEDVRYAISSVQPAVMAARLRAIGQVDERSALERVTVPTIYLQASKDRLVSPRSGEVIRAHLPALTVREVNAPHLLAQRRPDAAAHAVASLLKELPR